MSNKLSLEMNVYKRFSKVFHGVHSMNCFGESISRSSTSMVLFLTIVWEYAYVYSKYFAVLWGEKAKLSHIPNLDILHSPEVKHFWMTN